MSGITIKSDKELDTMRAAGMVVAHTKKALAAAVEPGITTKELDRIADREIRKQGAIPSFKGYRGFPASICVSINEQIVHGIPGYRVLHSGDVVSIDVGAIVDGLHGDSAFTMGVGDLSEDAKKLIDATREALLVGVSKAQPGARVGEISSTVQAYAESRGYGVVRKYVGHGIGWAMHEEPQVPNYGTPDRGPILRKGMAICIEPMLNIGTWDTIELDDGWTVITADGSLSAHFEDTIAITENGPEVLTSPGIVSVGV